MIGWGRRDRVCLPRKARRALHWFDHCGHFPQWDVPRDNIELSSEARAKAAGGRSLNIQKTPSQEPWSASCFQRLSALRDGREIGFLIWREVTPDEAEILDVSTEPDCRRIGVARSLLKRLLGEARGSVYLEVRESNLAARELYRSTGFQEIGRRPQYYAEPVEAAIVMKFYS